MERILLEVWSNSLSDLRASTASGLRAVFDEMVVGEAGCP
jgi:tRNA threonylcarbamoyladenosine modification (KEOPS) complex  Pcc1 subunit